MPHWQYNTPRPLSPLRSAHRGSADPVLPQERLQAEHRLGFGFGGATWGASGFFRDPGTLSEVSILKQTWEGGG